MTMDSGQLTVKVEKHFVFFFIKLFRKFAKQININCPLSTVHCPLFKGWCLFEEIIQLPFTVQIPYGNRLDNKNSGNGNGPIPADDTFAYHR